MAITVNRAVLAHQLFTGISRRHLAFPVPEIAKKLTIKTGKNAGKFPSVASLYRALAEAAADDGLPLRPKPARIRRPGESLTAEEIELRERLQSQPHPNAETRS